MNRIPRTKRKVKTLQQIRLAALRDDTLYYDGEIARAKGRIARHVTPACMAWLEAQLDEVCIGLFPSEKLRQWEALEAEVQNDEIWGEYERLARIGGDGAVEPVPACVSGEVGL
jgi:hypothetical protein